MYSALAETFIIFGVGIFIARPNEFHGVLQFRGLDGSR